MKVRIGARGSKLSLIQTNIIKKKLLKIDPSLEIEIKVIKTQGDKDLSPIPLDTVGKGWFTKELDRELLSGNIELAVHSLKDIPEELPDGLIIAGIPEREDARDVLVSKNNLLLMDLPAGAIIGTDSIRRKVQILSKRPDLIVKSLRGNVDSRLKKIQGNEYDAIVVAAAGLHRLQLTSHITEYFDVTDIIPSPGQGTLAIIVKNDNKDILSLAAQINDTDIIATTAAERAFSKAIGGGCKTPTGAYAVINKEILTVHGMITTEDETDILKDSIQGLPEEAKQLGITLAEKLLKKQHTKLFQFLKNKTIVITRPASESKHFEKKLIAYGATTYTFPTIKIVKNVLDGNQEEILKSISDIDWIIFTSAKGVDYFIETLKELHIPKEIVQNKKIAVVGPKTAEAITSHHLSVAFMPSMYTTAQLAKELNNISHKKILLARSNIGSKELVTELQKKHAVVFDVPIYKTEYIPDTDNLFENFVKNNTIHYITFTSPSTVTGFLKRISPVIKQEVLSIPVVSVGPVTTKAAKQKGFNRVITAREYTTEGMIKKLLEKA